MREKKLIYLVTDGAARGNPGPAAIGFGIYSREWGKLHEEAKYIGEATNNEAEYKALIWGLEEGVTYGRGSVKHFTDSQLLVRQLGGSYAVKADNLIPLYRNVKEKETLFEACTHEHKNRSDERIQRIDHLINEVLDKKGF